MAVTQSTTNVSINAVVKVYTCAPLIGKGRLGPALRSAHKLLMVPLLASLPGRPLQLRRHCAAVKVVQARTSVHPVPLRCRHIMYIYTCIIFIKVVCNEVFVNILYVSTLHVYYL